MNFWRAQMDKISPLHTTSRRALVFGAVIAAASHVAAAQSVAEFVVPTAGSQPEKITDGPDGALWFTEQTGNQIGRITITGAITEFPIPTAGSQPGGIVTGPDGNLWFTEQVGNKIAKMTTAGIVTEYPVPTPNSAPGIPVVGPDGAIWFNEVDGSKIGRITIAGAVTEFATPIANSQPTAMVSASDGNLWFAEANANRLSRITTAGVITDFVNPDATAAAHDIVAGPDGRLYFTEAHTGQIGVLTTAGIFGTETSPGNAVGDIGIGPDGAIWLPEPLANMMARASSTPAGLVVTEFALPTPASRPLSIAAGPDGNVWFTEADGNKIGRLIPPADPTPLLAAVLPTSRSVEVGATAMAFATVINTGATPLANCQIVQLTSTPTNFSYQTTDATTNALTGTANTPTMIAAGAWQSFFFSLAANAPFNPANVMLSFDCGGVDPAIPITGLNTLLLSGSATPVPDIILLAATPTGKGILDIPGTMGSAAFAVATANVGATGSIVVTADTGAATLPVSLTICQTNPTSGACLGAPAPSVSVAVNANQTQTFSVFATASGTIPFAPAISRIFVRFKDVGGITRGSTSVAVDTK